MNYEERLQLFNDNVKLARHTVRKHWSFPHLVEDDAYQEGLIALWEATDTYDNERAAFTTHAVLQINRHMRNYYFTWQYGKLGVSSYFQNAVTACNQAYTDNVNLEDYLESTKAPPVVRENARLYSLGRAAFVSLNSPNPSTANEGDSLEFGDAIPIDYNLEEAVINPIMDEELWKFIQNNFVKEQLKYKVKNTDRRKVLMNYFLEQLRGSDITQREIARRTNMSPNNVSTQFDRWRRALKRVIRTKWLTATERKLYDVE